MTDTGRRWTTWLAWSLLVLGLFLIVITLVLVWINRAYEEDQWFIPIVVLGISGYVVVGSVLASRLPSNPIGWLMLAVGLGFLLGGFSDEWTRYAVLTRSGEVDHPVVVQWTLGWANTSVTLIPLIFLLFPDGRPPGRRWRPLVVVLIVSDAAFLLSGMFAPGTTLIEGGGRRAAITKPFTWDALGVTESFSAVFGILMLVATTLTIVGLVLRYRRSAGDERQQIRWVAWAGAVTGVAILAIVPAVIWVEAGGPPIAANLAFAALATSGGMGIPAAIGAALLKYRLYDLDLVVKKTARFALVASAIAAVLLVLVAAVGVPFVGRSEDNPWALVAIGIVLGLAVLPLWRVSSRTADRIVFGGRASPYEALATFSHRVADTYESDEVLPRMAQILKETTRAEGATVWLVTGDELRPAAVAGDLPAQLSHPIGEDELPDLPSDHAAPVRHQGELLGALSVHMPSNDPIGPSRADIVDDLAAQAGAVLRNVRLVDDLRASRLRIVTAQDERARRLERNIHDGAQQQLVALAVKLRLARQMAEREPPAVAPLLEQLGDDANDALENLRALARGIYPPLLADKGLATALEAQSRKMTIPTRLESDGAGRYPQELEAAVYFCCLEALQNVSKYAGASAVVMRLHAGDGHLRFEVEDDGSGFDPASATHGTGLQGMADRLEAVGGRLDVRSTPGGGTTVAGRIPVAEPR